MGELNDNNIREAINKALAAKGMTILDSDSADVYLGHQVGFEKDQHYTTFGTGGGTGWGWGRAWGVGMGTATTIASTIVTGTLALDIYDSGERKLVWRGTASDTVTPTKDPAKLQKKLDKAAVKLFKNFPPVKK